MQGVHRFINDFGVLWSTEVIPLKINDTHNTTLTNDGYRFNWNLFHVLRGIYGESVECTRDVDPDYAYSCDSMITLYADEDTPVMVDQSSSNGWRDDEYSRIMAANVESVLFGSFLVWELSPEPVPSAIWLWFVRFDWGSKNENARLAII